MRITEVALTDIKSYKNRTAVPIEGGVTAILGENGAGKSTIQEAIGFALFDSLPFNNKDFVREGASSGTVEVTFEQETQQGTQQFRVTRSAGRAGYGVHRYDPEANEWVDQDIDSKKELIRWLCSRFDVEDGDELQSLWVSCIGVPQTRFLSDFAQTAANRTRTFDALLNLDAYEESWNVLKDVPDAIEKQQQDLRRDIDTLTGKVQGLPDKRAKEESLADDIEIIGARIKRKTGELSEKEAEYEELEAVEEKIERLDQEVDLLEGDIDSAESNLETAKEELTAAEKAQEKCEANREGYRRYKEARERQEELEKQEAERDTLVEERDEQEDTIQAIQFEVGQLDGDLKKLEAARETLETREEEKKRYEALEERIESLENRENDVETLEQEIKQLAEEIETKEREVESAEETIAEIDEEWEETTNPEALSDEINDRQASRKQLVSERDRLEEQLDRLRDTDVDAPCPTCDRPLDEDHRSETIEQREARIEEIETERKELAEELDTFREQREAARKVKQCFDKIPVHREKAESLEGEIEDLRAEREERQAELADLEDELAYLPNLEAERDDLEEAYDGYQTAEFRAEELADVPNELEAKRAELEEEQLALTEIEDELEAFDSLDEELTEVKETLGGTESAHQTYIKHQQQASQVEERQERVENLESELADLKADIEETEADLKETKASFDGNRFETLVSEVEDIKEELAGDRRSLDHKRENLEEVRETIEELESKLEERQEKLQQVKELKADQQFADWVRENVREAGPKMREIITDRIGQRANELFRSIRGASAETLEWTSDYEIVVHDANVRKSFSTLSGGEKMAAALAVRLAILEQLASVGIAFLDEPTANLDRQKKRNLVTQLKQLDSFDQLTVISHDETFDSMTDYTVTVTKDQQTSEVSVN